MRGLQSKILQELAKLPNVKVVDHTPNVREIYQQTRILLLLSRYESWGRVATEAMSNGIPVVYTHTPGLSENVADAGWMLNPRGERVLDERTNEIISHDGDTYDIIEAVEVLRGLDKPEIYNSWGQRGLSRYKQYQTQQHAQMREFGELLQRAQQEFANIRNTRRAG